MQIVSFASVRSVLFYEWDPIGVNGNANLSDEYDAYVAEIASVVNDGSAAEAVADRLHEIELRLLAKRRRITGTTSLHF